MHLTQNNEDQSSVLKQVSGLKPENPDNIALRSFDPDYFDGLSPALQSRLLNCMRSGIENPDSEMGCYANFAGDYDDLFAFFSRAIARFHRVGEDQSHKSNWTLPEPQGDASATKSEASSSSLPALSTRIRVARNLAGFPLPAAMSLQDRLRLEQRMGGVFKKLQDIPEFSGDYFSLTPGHPDQISNSEYQDLIDAHIMFKPMQSDRFLISAGIASDWPHGRGAFVSENKSFIVWVGEEDQLRIMVMAETTSLSYVFNRLRSALNHFSDLGLEFATSEHFGNITSCPTNLGTGMRASVHMRLPHMTSQLTESELKQKVKPLGLSIRGLGGEHTGFGADGTVDISPRARFGITEADILKSLHNGIGQLRDAEARQSTR